MKLHEKKGEVVERNVNRKTDSLEDGIWKEGDGRKVG